MLEQDIVSLAQARGCSLIGFCTLDEKTKQSIFIKSLPEMKYAITIAVKLSNAVLQSITNKPTFAYFQHYRIANAKLDDTAFDIANLIEKNGYLACPVAASQSMGNKNAYQGIVSHKAVAVQCGLGFVGKSGLFISKEYGSKLRLATILTDMPVESDLPIISNGCGNCKACVNACPCGAIYGEIYNGESEKNIDAEKCSHYMKENFQDIGRGSVCGICIKACPYNNLND